MTTVRSRRRRSAPGSASRSASISSAGGGSPAAARRARRRSSSAAAAVARARTRPPGRRAASVRLGQPRGAARAACSTRWPTQRCGRPSPAARTARRTSAVGSAVEPVGQSRRSARGTRRSRPAAGRVIARSGAAASTTRPLRSSRSGTRNCPATSSVGIEQVDGADALVRQAARGAQLGEAAPRRRAGPLTIARPADSLNSVDERVGALGQHDAGAGVAAQARLDERLGQTALGQVVGGVEQAVAATALIRTSASSFSRSKSTAGGRPPRKPCTAYAHSEPPNSSRVSPSR